MSILGVIFSNIHNKEMFEVSKYRTIASTPIGGRYRLIDFSLSNMVNAGITQIGVVTKNNYQSLMGHVGSGKEWDLARKNGGLVILPPFGFTDEVYNTRLEAIKSITSFINHSKAEYVVLTDCYHVCNIDYKDVLAFHKEKGADITCVYRECSDESQCYFPVNAFSLAEDGRVEKMDLLDQLNGTLKLSVDTWVLKRELLQALVIEAMNTNYNSFNRDILSKNLKNLKIYGYHFKGYFGNICNLKSYYSVSKDLLKKEVRDELFNQPGRAIYTKVRDSAPTIYGDEAKISNSLIADGCVIEGEVVNSIIFRGTKVKKGCRVENSILMQDTVVGENIVLNKVITDKNVQIKHKNELSGSDEFPIYVKKNGVL